MAGAAGDRVAVHRRGGGRGPTAGADALRHRPVRATPGRVRRPIRSRRRRRSYDPASLTERSRRRLARDPRPHRAREPDGPRGRLRRRATRSGSSPTTSARMHGGSTSHRATPGRPCAATRVHLVEGDIAVRGSLPEATFDRAISFTVWEHITHPIEAITELARVMKPAAWRGSGPTSTAARRPRTGPGTSRSRSRTSCSATT